MKSAPLPVLLCQSLFAEAQAALEQNPIPGLELSCLSRTCTPRRRELQALLEEAGRYSEQAHGALLVGGGCLVAHQGLSHPAELQLACRSTCFHFFLPPEQIQTLLNRGAYLVTSGWLLGWRQVMAEWGLNQSEARAFFAESCTCIVLLEVGEQPLSRENLAAFASFVGLPAERVKASLGHLRVALLEEAWAAREAQMVRQAQELGQARRRIGEQAALVDLVQRLSATIDEEAIVRVLLEVAQSLFAPGTLLWLSHWKGQWGEAQWLPSGPPLAELEAELRACAAGVQPTAAGDGMLLRFEGPDGPMGALGLAQLAFPNQIPTYLGTARTLLDAAQLALGNARNLHGMIRICAWCRKVKDEDKGWGSFEDYLHEQSSATFSHGMCPDCASQLTGQAETKKTGSPD